MEENENPKEKLIENINIQNKIRNNLISGDQIIPKAFEEKLCCCCINYDLTVSEYKSFNSLKKKVIPSYNPQNEEHEKTLKELFNKTKELLNNDNNISSSEITEITTKENSNEDENEKIWRKIGFQTKEPRNDFRGGGIYSLDLMMYFIKNFEKDYFNIINEDYFTFALTCIRVSYLIRTYLYLLTSEEIRINSKFQRGIFANRKQLKYFCYFLIDNDNLLNDICCTSIISIFQKFKEKKTGQKEKNYLIIEPIIQNSVQCLQNSLNDARLNDNFISHLKESYRQNFLRTLD
jgi:hypothetical protein